MNSPKPPVMLVTGGTGSIDGEVARQTLAADWSVVIQGRSNQSVENSLSLLASAIRIVHWRASRRVSKLGARWKNWLRKH